MAASDSDVVHAVEDALRSALASPRSQALPWLTPRLCAALVAEDDCGDAADETAAFVEVPEAEVARRLARVAPHVLYWMSLNGVPATGLVSRRSGSRASHAEDASRVLAAIAAGDGPTKPPSRPLVRELACRLVRWSEGGRFPVAFPALALLDDMPQDDVSCIEGRAAAAVSALVHNPTQQELACSVLEALGLGGVRALLGLRTTRGSVLDVLPPGIGEIVAAFRTLHSAASGARLTVGARALAKHCRRSTCGWWGDGLAGTEAEKNARAEAVLVRILSQAAWLNIHALPHDVHVYEVRNAAGYGARWLVAYPHEFRGFLEPQMESGHAVGWVH